MCNSPSSLFGDKSMLSTSTKRNTYLHLLPTLFCTCAIYVYVQIHQIYTQKITKFVYVQILKYTSNCNSFSIHKLRFYHVVRAMMGPEVQHLQSSTEHRGNKDIFTSPSFHQFIHPHTRSPIWQSFAQISGSESNIGGVFLRQPILLIEESYKWRAAGIQPTPVSGQLTVPPTPRLFLSHPLRYLASLPCVSQQQSLRQHTQRNVSKSSMHVCSCLPSCKCFLSPEPPLT